MNCEQVGEYVSALCDGEKIPRDAAEHIGSCPLCREELNQYAAIGLELRRLASLEEAPPAAQIDWEQERETKIGWWQKGLTTMRIPRLAFGVMLSAIIALSGGLVLVRARAGSTGGRFLELKYRLPVSPFSPYGRLGICIMRTDGSQKDNTCDFVDHGWTGLLLMNTHLIMSLGDTAEVGIRAKFVPGPGDTQINYTQALFEDVPEKTVSLAAGEEQEIEVAGLGKVGLQREYLDHIPPLEYRPQETLDPNPREFRIVTPVLLRDNQAIAKVDGNSIDTGDADATLMLYVPGEGRYLISIAPFEGAVQGDVHLGQITFSLEGHHYLLLTSTPITVLEHVWVKQESEFKPSERMARLADARDDRPMFLVRSLEKLERQRIEH